MKCMLIIGRFQPFHSGHLEIIRKYHRKDFFVKVVVGSSQDAHQKDNPFTKDERVEMIRKSLDEHKIINYDLIIVPDVPSDEEWVSSVKRLSGCFDVVFTGNPWVKRLFRKENVELHEFDERFDRIRGIKAKDIRRNLLNSKSRKGLPVAVFNYLKVISAFDRLKEMNDSKKKVHYLLSTNKLSVCSAESCTGGAISRALISYSGSSNFFKGGVVAYSIEAKKNLLGVNIDAFNSGLVSAVVVKQMVLGALNLFGADYAVSSTGFADPVDKDVGKVFLAVASRKEVIVKEFFFKTKGNIRSKIIDRATNEAVKLLYVLLKKDLFGDIKG